MSKVNTFINYFGGFSNLTSRSFFRNDRVLVRECTSGIRRPEGVANGDVAGN